jgi:hypothetical protein
VRIIDDFEAGDGHFTTVSAVGASVPIRVRTADDSYTKTYAQKVNVVDDLANPNGWYVRLLSGGGLPGSNESIPLTDGADGTIGFFLRVSANSPLATPLTAELVLDGGGTDSDAGVPRTLITDGDWHYYEWDLDDPSDWTAWRDANGNVVAGSDGVLPPAGNVSIDSILLRGGNGSAEFFVDGVMRNAGGSLSAMLPVPEPGVVGMMSLASIALLRRRRRA